LPFAKPLEMWSFVGRKSNKQWIWIAMDARNRQIITFYIGDRSRKSARKLWESIPRNYREKATFYMLTFPTFDKTVVSSGLRNRVT
jgi:IS1 family transposase